MLVQFTQIELKSTCRCSDDYIVGDEVPTNVCSAEIVSERKFAVRVDAVKMIRQNFGMPQYTNIAYRYGGKHGDVVVKESFEEVLRTLNRLKNV